MDIHLYSTSRHCLLIFVSPVESLPHLVKWHYTICDTLRAPYGMIWIDRAWYYNPETAYEFIILSNRKVEKCRSP